jgi:hypothetical protein
METTGPDPSPAEEQATPTPGEEGYESVSGGETTPPSGAPETAESEQEDA